MSPDPEAIASPAMTACFGPRVSGLPAHARDRIAAANWLARVGWANGSKSFGVRRLKSVQHQ
jgi:hypothetical protein